MSQSPMPQSTVPTFVELGLPLLLAETLHEQGITAPFPIQAAALPDALAGKDVLGRGPTGSGKTLTFGLPMLARLSGAQSKPRQPRGLVLVPTRELALQVTSSLGALASAVGLRVTTVLGGVPMGRQINDLARGVDLLVATPGRLADLMQQGAVSLDQVRITALDEADHMADMGFLPQVIKLLDRTPADSQRLLFSATLDGDVDKLVKRYLKNPVTHSTAPSTASVSTMEHHLLFVSQDHKKDIIAEIASRDGRTILFARTKHGVDRLTKQLRSVGVHAGALHGGKAQGNRNRTLDAFKDGSVPVLVATDVAARGIHVDEVSLVVHVDPPADPKDYLHRAGRTARAGESGVVVTLVTPGERRDVETMTRKAGIAITGVNVRPGDHELARISGARTPSGIPLPAPAEPAPSASKGPRRARPAGAAGSTGGRSGAFRGHRTSVVGGGHSSAAAGGRGPASAGRGGRGGFSR